MDEVDGLPRAFEDDFCKIKSRERKLHLSQLRIGFLDWSFKITEIFDQTCFSNYFHIGILLGF